MANKLQIPGELFRTSALNEVIQVLLMFILQWKQERREE
jgi:hypothetical protein